MLRGPATVNFWAADPDASRAGTRSCWWSPPNVDRPGYAEFRIGDHQAALG